MEIYEVGGAVRDSLLGRPVADRDWVVTGATPEDMLALGYRQVGRDFPVFLHPQTHEEYALARIERKQGSGYHGFSFDTSLSVTLEQDLARRDVTINAMARDAQGRLIDPYGGQADLAAGILRHITPAFAEDPLRVLRVARFAARFGYRVAPDTLALMRQLAAGGELLTLSPERVWRELERALSEIHPARFFTLLRECGALVTWLPEIDRLFDMPALATTACAALDKAAARERAVRVRFALLLAFTVHAHAQPLAAIEALCARLKVPATMRELALLGAKHCATVAQVAELDASAVVALLEAIDGARRPERLLELLEVCALRADVEITDYPPARLLSTINAAFRAARPDAAALAQGGPAVREALHHARLTAVAHALRVSRSATPD